MKSSKGGRIPRFIEDDAPKSKSAKKSKSGRNRTVPEQPAVREPKLPAVEKKTAKAVKISTPEQPAAPKKAAVPAQAAKAVSAAGSSQTKKPAENVKQTNAPAEKPKQTKEPVEAKTVSIADASAKKEPAVKTDEPRTVSITDASGKKEPAVKSDEPRTVSITDPAAKKAVSKADAMSSEPRTVSITDAPKAKEPEKKPVQAAPAKPEKASDPDGKTASSAKDQAKKNEKAPEKKAEDTAEKTAESSVSSADAEEVAENKPPKERGYQAAKKRREQEKLAAKNKEKQDKQAAKVKEKQDKQAVKDKEKQDNQDAKAELKEEKEQKKHKKLYDASGKKRMRGWKKALIAVVSVVLVLAISLVSTFFILREIGRRSMHKSDSVEIITPTADESGNQIVSEDKYGRLITYNGKTYSFNNDVMTLTLIGVDNANGAYTGTHMADAIYILAIDAKTGKTTILGVSRDTMGDVDLYSEEGKFIRTENLQLCYSYDYYSDEVTRGDNTNKSVSRLFFNLPLKNYFAINMDAIPDLNDAIGGVTVDSLMEFKSPEDGRIISEGETVTLKGKEAEYYVQHRDLTQLTSNVARMERQQQYVRAFISSILPAIKKDLSVIGQLVDVVNSNSDSTMDVPKLTYLASVALPNMKSIDDVDFVNLKGDITYVKPHAQVHVSNEEIMRTMLSIFYKPMGDSEE